MPIDRQTIDASGAPQAAGPYSHAVRSGQLLFCSMQIPLDPASGELAGDTPVEQVRRCMLNLTAVAEAAGATLADATKLTVYVTDLSAFAEINDAYASFFTTEPPARAAVEVSALPRGAQVAVDAIIALPD